MKNLIVILSVSLTLWSSCKKEEVEVVTTITKPLINGVVQKGPYLNGTSITIYELKNDLSQTGKSYSSEILDNSGKFQLSNVTLNSKYIQLKADGYYFNEVTGQNSKSTITLYSLSDISNKSSVNINILSHLEKSRVEYLISTGKLFEDAKKQAEQEILNIFSITKTDVSNFDLMNISEDGENNAILLAVSLITQGFRTESELSDLLANINTDIRQDGKLDAASIGSLLINDARLLDLPKIRNNIEKRYANLGMTVTIPNFEKYIADFISKTTFQITNSIVYSEFSTYGENVLFGTKTSFSTGLSLAAYLPQGTSLKIILKGGVWFYQSLPKAPVNWTISDYDFKTQQQTFTATESGKNCDLIFQLYSGPQTIEYYENNATTPTRIKTLVAVSSLNYIYPSTGANGPNILNSNFIKTMTELSNSLRAEVSTGGALKIIIKGGGAWKIDGTVTNWTVESFNSAKQWQIFTVTEVGKHSDLPIIFTTPGIYRIDYYENNDIAPSHMKQITIV